VQAQLTSLPGVFSSSMNDRNKRIFDDSTDHAAAQNRQPFLLHTFRPHLANGDVLLVKEAVASVWIGDSFWGSILLAYDDPGSHT
jgi:hypothetical protein